MQTLKSEIINIGKDYFKFMAQSYPVMCLSDEFPFLPRASQAIQYLDCLDCLDEQKVKQDIAKAKGFKDNLEKFQSRNLDLEAQIDYQLLNQSIAIFLHEFQAKKIWQNDPTLYLKIIALSIDQVINKLPLSQSDRQETLASRLKQIPSLLDEAKRNAAKFPALYQETAINMSKTIVRVLQRYAKHSSSSRLTKTAIHSLLGFQGFLKKRPSSNKAFTKNKGLLQHLLSECYAYKHSLKQIYAIACQEYDNTLKECRRLAKHINPSGNLQSIVSGYKLKAKNKNELLKLYSHQITSLKDFLIKQNLINIPKMQNIRVRQTPVYLEPIRASASYSCPITADKKESVFFYVSIDGIKENIHQEYAFVTAHETFPGHHLLDTIRRNLANPIRRQIESPLFYEGWASYAERLIDEFGYIKDPAQRLVGLRRQAWRAIRAKLDAGISINRIKASDAARQLSLLGYSKSRAKAMIKHYILTSGYQLCYTIGKIEIEKLRDKFASKMGIKNFHNCLLKSGQIPFDLIKNKMEKLCQVNS